MNGTRGGDLVFIGDVHLQPDDPDLAAFLTFLRAVAMTADRIVLAGDLFDLWLGGRDMDLPHYRAVTDVLRELRRAGTVIRYLEGNRDFHVAKTFAGDAFDDATDAGVVERCGGHRIFAIHGDLANPADLRYRAWRRVAHADATWALFRALPAGARVRAAESIERRMRASNRAFKRSFPEVAVRSYAARFFARGHDAVVLGHFHVERDLAAKDGRILVLPEWKGSRRHLRFGRDGSIRFEPSVAP